MSEKPDELPDDLDDFFELPLRDDPEAMEREADKMAGQ
jgi:hypothetical protein